ncbi:hypothetical protein [Methylobacterium sp. J-076]|uniref:hypothetical protein n=1 Tax=Methylobacterium sp. J-076 TaxID=2836655 RepID=UPI001FBAE56C|nr:hypothetical protein [Methylobacterium sp. J-076]MCJ2012590.1 hypothetical protein [Methylobacterium sp. J-076]
MMRLAAFSTACLMLAAPALASAGSVAVAAQAPRPGGWLRGVEPGTTGSVQPSSEAPAKPSCPPGRRVGTGAGFCLIN